MSINNNSNYCHEQIIFRYQDQQRMNQTCQQCKFEFHLTSQRFFCCNQSQVVCSTCRRRPCNKCKKPRTIQIIIPKCSRCHSRLYQNDLLLENNCGRYYCSKCLSDLFKDAYFKVMIEKCYEGQDLELALQLYCGHEFLYEDLVRFFQHFCLACGREYDSTLDYELIDGVKLCFLCYRSLQQFFQQLLIKCQLCQFVIKNSSYASILDNSEMAICQRCTKESQISETLISESRKKQQKQTFQRILEPKQQKVQEIKEFVKSPLKPTIQAVQQKIPQKHPVVQVPSKQQQKSPSIPKSPLTKLFKKPSISQLKQKQEKRTSNNKSNSISVTSRFSNNFEQIDEEITESLGLPQDFKLKKHLSNQTYVENYLIEIASNDPSKFVKCKRCCGLTDQKLALNLYDFEAEMNNSRLTTFSFKPNGEISSIGKKQSYFICRVCYYKSSQRQKSILNASISTRVKSSMSNRPSKLEETTSSMDYLKPGKSSRKDMRSPSPSPNKQYSLTGSKDSFILKQTKSSLLLPQKSSVKHSMPSYQRHPKSREATSQSIPPKSMKCDKCRNIKKSLIASIHGYYCDDCYYGRSLYSDPFFGR